MNKKISMLLCGAVALNVIGGGLNSVSADVKKLDVQRVKGEDRFATSVEISKKAYDKAETVILVSGKNYPDALASGALASKLKAPILLVEKNKIPKVVNDEIVRLGAKNIIIIGGSASIDTNVEKEIATKYKVERISGVDRYETSIKVSKKLMDGKEKYPSIIVNGNNFADSLSAGALGSSLDLPVILTNGKSISSSLKEILDVNSDKNVLIGGSSSMNIAEIKGTKVQGKDRYDTSQKIAEKYFAKSENIVVASGRDFPDGLASVTLFNKYKAPILLNSKERLNENIKKYIENSSVSRALLIGGINSLSNNIENELSGKSGETNSNIVSGATKKPSGGSGGGSSSGSVTDNIMVNETKTGIVSLGYAKYIVVTFEKGVYSDYTITVDGKDISTKVSKVDDSGKIVKWEIEKLDHKEISVKNKATGEDKKITLKEINF